jgi:hypothetical protein
MAKERKVARFSFWNLTIGISLELGHWGLEACRRRVPGKAVPCRRGSKKNLLLRRQRLSFAAYAEANCSQQNAQISSKTLQDHRTRQSVKSALFASAFAFGEKRKTQTPAK